MIDRLKQSASQLVSGIILLFVIFYVPYFLFYGLPLDTPMANRLEMFRALAQIGGALVGFAGIVGVFGLDAIRSAMAENSRTASDLQIRNVTQFTSPSEVDLRITDLYRRNALLRRYMESSLKDMFLTLVFFLVQIIVAVLGLSGESQSDWRGGLTLCFTFLSLGTYVLYTLTRRVTAVAE